MEKILSSEMANEEMTKLAERKNAIATEIEEKRSVFETADVETRETVLSEVEELEKEAEEIDEQVKELEEQRNKFAEQEERMSLVKNVEQVKIEGRKEASEVDKYDTEEYRKAWVDMVRGDDTEMRALMTTTTNVPVPTIMQGYVETAWENYGKFSRLVSKSFIEGYLAIPLEVAADGAVWHDEGSDAPAEENITLGQVLLQPKTIKKWISLTDELMALAPQDFMRYIADEVVYRVIKALDDAIINRTAADGKGVIGIVNNPNTLSVESALTFNAINAVIAQLVTFDNLTIAMNPQTFFSNYMGLTDLQGRPIYQVATDNAGKPRYMINGIPVEFTLALPAYDSASSGDVWAVVGDFKGYRLNLPQGENVITLVDELTLAREDKAYMLGRLLAAGNVTRLKHFGQLKKA